MTDELTAALEEIRKRSDWASGRYAEVTTVRDSAADVPRLLAAVEAALKLAEPTGEVHRDLDGNEEHGIVHVVRCDTLRAAITSALDG